MVQESDDGVDTVIQYVSHYLSNLAVRLSLPLHTGLGHQVPPTSRRRQVAHTDRHDRAIDSDTGPDQI